MNEDEFLGQLKERLGTVPKTLVLPESQDNRIIAAARRLVAERLTRVVLLGREADLADRGIDPHEFAVIDPANSADLDRYAQRYSETRQRTDLKVARRLLKKPLFFAGMMIRCGDADGLVAGVSYPSAKILEASLLTIGLAPDVETPSSCFLMLLPPHANPEGEQRMLLFADCALNVDPSAEQLADIGMASAATFQALVQRKPRVAFLSFSTKGSARQPQAKRVARAVEITHERLPELAADGELQFDAAVAARVAALKVSEPGAVAGRANVLIFPSLEAGNIGYKLAQYLAGATPIGPLLQGFAGSVSDLSRGATVDDIVTTSLVTLAR